MKAKKIDNKFKGKPNLHQQCHHCESLLKQWREDENFRKMVMLFAQIPCHSILKPNYVVGDLKNIS